MIYVHVHQREKQPCANKPIILRWGDIRGNRELKDMKELEGASENIEDSEI